VDTQRLNYLLIVKEEDKRVGEIRRKNINKIISVLHIKKKEEEKKEVSIYISLKTTLI
jgi:hypothetical protein